MSKNIMTDLHIEQFKQIRGEFAELFEGDEGTAVSQVIAMSEYVAQAELLLEIEEKFGDVVPKSYLMQRTLELLSRAKKLMGEDNDKL